MGIKLTLLVVIVAILGIVLGTLGFSSMTNIVNSSEAKVQSVLSQSLVIPITETWRWMTPALRT